MTCCGPVIHNLRLDLEITEGCGVHGQYLGLILGEITCLPFLYTVCGADVNATVFLTNLKGHKIQQSAFFKNKFKAHTKCNYC